MKDRFFAATIAAAVTGLLPLPALAEDLPFQAKLSVMPTSLRLIGLEAELGPRRMPLAFGMTINSNDYFPFPADAAVWTRTTSVHPSEDNSLGLVAGANWSQAIGTEIATGKTILATNQFEYMVGLSYQRAWGDLWLRVSPNVSWAPNSERLNPPFVKTLLSGPPWFEIGYHLTPNFELGLRSTTTPVRSFNGGEG